MEGVPHTKLIRGMCMGLLLPTHSLHCLLPQHCRLKAQSSIVLACEAVPLPFGAPHLNLYTKYDAPASDIGMSVFLGMKLRSSSELAR